jgi:hypothetical protein
LANKEERPENDLLASLSIQLASVYKDLDKLQEADEAYLNAFNWIKLDLLKVLAANSQPLSED